MSRLKKIVFIIIVFLICISVHNVSSAATVGYSIKSNDCSKHANCKTYTLKGITKKYDVTVHENTKTGKLTINDGFPRLDYNVGDLCEQHDNKNNSVSWSGMSKYINYRIEINDLKVTVTPLNSYAKSNGVKKGSINSTLGTEIAYILSKTPMTIANTKEDAEDNRRDNGVQVALWQDIKSFFKELKDNTLFNYHVESIGSAKNEKSLWNYSVNTKAKEIHAAANEFANKMSSYKKPKNKSGTVETEELDEDYYKIGPYKMQHSVDGDFSKFSSIQLLADGKALSQKNWGLIEETVDKGNKIEISTIDTPTSNTNFYVKVKKTAIEGKKITLQIKIERKTISAKFYDIISPGMSQQQMILLNATIGTKIDTLTFDEISALGNLKIEKRDEYSDKTLIGVGFTIKNSNGKYLVLNSDGNVTESATATTIYTNNSGIIELNNIPIDTYTIEEVSVGNYYGYELDKDRITWTVNKEEISTGISVNVSIEGQSTDVTVTNEQKYTKVGGFVWEDIADTKSNNYDNLYTVEDILISGIKVSLFKREDQVVTDIGNNESTDDEYDVDDYEGEDDSIYENSESEKEEYIGRKIAECTTDTNGKYQFMDLEIDELSNYYIEFEYDGLKFTSVEVDKSYSGENYNISSKAQEVPRGREDKKDRETVNNDFAIITNDKSSNSSGNRGYELDYSFENNKSTYIDKWEYKYTDKTRLQVTTAKNSEYAIIASTKTARYDLQEAWETQCKSTISGINLGIKRREQADLAIGSDLHKVNIKINKTDGESYENTYTYENRKIDSDTYDFGIETKFGTKVGSYSNRGLNTYTRRIYESDLAYDNNQSLMEIYVTYRIRVKNQSTALYTKVNEIANYYDDRYSIETSWIGDSETNTIEWKKTSNASQKGYKVGYTEGIKDITINPNGYVDIYVKFKLTNDAVKALASKQTTLNNVSEITSFSTVDKDNNPYAAIDIDSNPGNATIKLSDTTSKKTKLNNRDYEIETKTLDSNTYEDDTDWAPSLVIGIQDGEVTRGLSGTVFEDASTYNETTGRLGNGIFDETKEKKIENAKVELLELPKDENGNYKVAKLYKLKFENNQITTEETDAVTYTNDEGYYEFDGVIPGKYVIRYTYGTFETKDENGKVIETKTTNIITKDESGQITRTEINVRDYKSTIITSNIIKNALNLGKNNEREGDYNWIVKYEGNGNSVTRYSDAVDDINKRNDEDDLYYEKYEKSKIGNKQMTADTAYFNIGVEYSEGEFAQQTYITQTDYKNEYKLENGKIIVFNEAKGTIELVNTFYAVNPYQDFGIVERARQNYEINKRVSDLKITLSNGQVLINGNPYNEIAEGTELTKLESEPSGLPYVKALPSEVIAEIDNEIVQKAKLEIEYTIAIKNNSEKDDDYRQNKDYYFYGGTIKNPITAAITKVVDYMEDGLIYNDQENQGKGWTKVTAGDLKKYSEEENGVKIEKQLISDEVYNDIKQGYTIAITNGFKGLGVGETRQLPIYASKVLTANGTEVENHVEIIETKGIRAIEGSEPGNYNPKDAKPDEPDDDKTKLIITPPTGLPDNKILIITVTTISLLVLATGIYFIKKKIL